MNNRIQVGAEWSKSTRDDLFRIEIPQPVGTLYIYRPSKVTTTGIAAYAAMKIIDRSSLTWTTRLNVLFPKSKTNVSSLGFSFAEPTYKLQGGLQNYFSCHRFYAQINGLLGTNRHYYSYNIQNPIFEELTATDFILNYALLGYTFPSSDKSFFSNISVFVHARNVLGTSKTKEYYAYDSYAGAGIQLQLK
jgi:hypothetical protein